MALEGSGVQSWRGGGVGMNWLVVLTRLNFFDLPFSSQGDFFLWSLKNMSVSFRVKDQCQAAPSLSSVFWGSSSRSPGSGGC